MRVHSLLRWCPNNLLRWGIPRCGGYRQFVKCHILQKELVRVSYRAEHHVYFNQGRRGSRDGAPGALAPPPESYIRSSAQSQKRTLPVPKQESSHSPSKRPLGLETECDLGCVIGVVHREATHASWLEVRLSHVFPPSSSSNHWPVFRSRWKATKYLKVMCYRLNRV